MHSAQRTARGVAAVTAALVGGGLIGITPALAAPAADPTTTASQPAVGNPTGEATGNSWIHEQDRVAYIAGHFRNTDTVPVDVRLLTDHGQSEAQRVAPGQAVYVTVNTKLAELAAGTATFRVYKNVAGKGYQSLLPVTYPAATAPAPEPAPEVGNPTGEATGNSYLHEQDGVAYIAGHFRNTDTVPVDVRLLTDHGQSEAQRVAPGEAAYVTVNTQLTELPAGTATFRVYKFVAGKGYQSLFPITYPGQPAGPVDDGVTELQLLGINDFHGRLAEGVAVAGTIEEQRAREDVDATLLLSAGDNIGASPFVSSVQQDEPTIAALNAMGLQTSAVGNHEFDRGFADLVERVGVDGTSGLADYSQLGANVYRDGAPALPEYVLLDAGGVNVGVIGVVTEETRSLVSPSGIEGITFGDPVEATNRVVGALTDGVGDEADVIVLLAHEGAPGSASLADELAKDTAFAAIVEDVDAQVDAIFTGHTHQSYAWSAPVPGAAGETRPVIQTGSYGDALGRIALTYDEAADDVTAFTVENLPLTERPADELVAAYPSVAAVSGIVAAAQAYADEVGSVVVGSVTADITRAFTAAGTEDRGSYSALGGLVADTYVYGSELSAIEPADLGLVNPGGLRADLLYGADGQITVAEANAVTPFANDLVVTSLTGAQLVQVLEQQWQPAGSSRPFLALGASEELTWSYDPAAPAGERILVDSIRISGEPIDLAATYRVATNSFLASGGDNFTAFAQGSTEGTGLIDFDSFQAYLEDNSPLDPASFTGRVSTGTATEPGTGTDPGTEPGTGTDPGTEPGTGTDPGTQPGTDPGTQPGTDPVTDPGTGGDTGSGNGPGQAFGSFVTWAKALLVSLVRGWFGFSL